MDFVLIVVVLLGLAWVWYAARDLTRVMLYLLGSISVASVLLTAWHRLFGNIPVTLAQALIALTFVLVAIFYRPTKNRSSIKVELSLLLPIASLIIAGVLVIARVVTLRENPLFFTGAGRLAYAEDNAKWFNFAANLAQDNALNFKDGTTGSLAVLLVLSGAIVSIASFLLFGGENIAGISISTVLVTHSLALILVPLTLSPIVTKYFSTATRGGSVHEKNNFVGVVAGLIVAVVVAATSMAAITTHGHLSLETVFLQLLFWLVFTLYLWDSQNDLFLITLIGASASLVWLPLPPLSMAIMVGAIALAAYRLFKTRTREILIQMVSLIVVFIVLLWLTTPEVTYLSASTRPSTSTHLVFAEGATQSPTNFEWVMLFLVFAGIALFAWSQRAALSFSKLSRLYPLVLVIGFSAAVFAYDYVVAPAGWPHYGSRKLGYLVVMMTIIALLPLAFYGFQLAARGRSQLLYLAGGAFVVALLLSQTFTQASHYSFKRDAWTNFDVRKIDGKPLSTYWAKYITPPNSAQSSLESYPIACVQAKNGVITPGINDAYFCTRLVMSLHGAESFTNALFYPILIAPSQANIDAMRALPPEILALSVLVLDANGSVVDTISVGEYIEIYENQKEEVYADL